MLHVTVWNQQHSFQQLLQLSTFEKEFYLHLKQISGRTVTPVMFSTPNSICTAICKCSLHFTASHLQWLQLKVLYWYNFYSQHRHIVGYFKWYKKQKICWFIVQYWTGIQTALSTQTNKSFAVAKERQVRGTHLAGVARYVYCTK